MKVFTAEEARANLAESDILNKLFDKIKIASKKGEASLFLEKVEHPFARTLEKLGYDIHSRRSHGRRFSRTIIIVKW